MRVITIILLLCPYVLLSQNFLSNKKIILPNELPEASGLFAASTDSLWWLNDSGNDATLFLTDNQGRLLNRVEVPHTINRDWEDITNDQAGNIYIGDFGNNANKRKDLRVYIFNPAINRIDSIHFTYEDQADFPPSAPLDRFDLEAMIFLSDTLHLFTKDRVGRGKKYTKHYILPASPGTYEARLLDSLVFKKRVVTGAAYNKETNELALLTYNFRLLLGFIPLTPTDIYFLQDFPESRFFAGSLSRKRIRRTIRPTQYEAIDYYDDKFILIASERVPLFRQQARYIRLK